MTKDMSASIHARLLYKAQSERQDFQYVLIRYANERLLRRLSCTVHVHTFILKGATLFGLWLGEPHRATRDVDLLGFGEPAAARLADIFREVCEVEVEADGLRFDSTAVQVAPIRVDEVYGGLRVTLSAYLGKAKLSLQIDVGFGDAVHPAPDLVELPTLLSLPPPRVRVYPRESVIAEKLEALVSLGRANSRLKDFYDLWFLATTFSFGPDLGVAVRSTFARRGTPLPEGVPDGLTEAFATDPEKLIQWTAFLRRAGVSSQPHLDEVAAVLREFLGPVFAGEPEPDAIWPPGGPWGPQ